MNNEIDDLLEINASQNTSKVAIKQENINRYLLIHLLIMLVLSGLTYYTLIIESAATGYGEVILFGGLFLVFLLVILIEIIYFQVTKKIQLRNYALITLLIFILSTIGLLNIMV